MRGVIVSPNSTFSLTTSWSSAILLAVDSAVQNSKAIPLSPHLLDLKCQLSSISADGIEARCYLSFDSAGAKPMAGVSSRVVIASIAGNNGGCVFGFDMTLPPFWDGETEQQCYLWLKLESGTATLTAKGAALGFSDASQE